MTIRMKESTIDMVPSRIGGCGLMKANDNCRRAALTNLGVTSIAGNVSGRPVVGSAFW